MACLRGGTSQSVLRAGDAIFRPVMPSCREPFFPPAMIGSCGSLVLLVLEEALTARERLRDSGLCMVGVPAPERLVEDSDVRMIELATGEKPASSAMAVEDVGAAASGNAAAARKDLVARRACPLLGGRTGAKIADFPHPEDNVGLAVPPRASYPREMLHDRLGARLLCSESSSNEKCCAPKAS